MKGYFKCLLGFSLLFIPTLVLAQFESSPLWDMFQNLTFDPKPGDQSVVYLGKIFGAVPGVPQFSSYGGTIMGAIFGVFNAGILALSGVFLSYTITKIVTETTMDGAAMGKSTTIWTSVRCALSTSLLVPQATGYSLINGIIMWVVVQSVGLANVTWDRAMDYLGTGGTAVSTSASQMDYSFINYDIGGGSSVKAKNVGAADVLQSLTCAHAVHDALVASQKATRDRLLDKQAGGEKLSQAELLMLNQASASIPELSEGGTGSFSLYLDSKDEGVYQFPYADTKKLGESGLNVHGDIPELSGICGVISYGKYSKHSKNDAIYVPAKSSGLRDMINLLNPTAKELIEKLGIDLDTNKAELDVDKYVVYTKGKKEHKFLKSDKVAADKMYVNKNLTVFDFITSGGLIKSGKPVQSIDWPVGTDSILSAAAAYQVAIKNAQFSGAAAAKKGEKKEYKKAKKYGWIMAGSYYRLLAKVQDINNADISSHRLIGYKTPTTPYSKDEDNPGIRGEKNPAYRTLMPVANDDEQNSTNPVAVIDKDIFSTMKKAMTWIQLTYPYSMLRGKILEPLPSTTETGFGIEGLGINDTKLISADWIGDVTALEVATYVATVAGGLLLAIVPAVAIPILAAVPMAFLTVDVNKVFLVWQKQMGSGSSTKDPIIKLRNLGESMMEQSMAFTGQMGVFMGAVFVPLLVMSSIYERLALAASGFGLSTGFSQYTQVAVIKLNMIMPMIQSIVFVTLPIALAVLIPMFVSGVMLYVYVPLIPFMLFLFGVISWFISVIVLMAAAPIICFLMLWGNSSQENPLLAREAESFLMQIIGVFFRPTLMIIGLVAGVALSYIGVDVLNTAFNIIVQDPELLSTTGAAAYGKKIAVVIVYTATMMSLVNMCFSPIHLLYNEAMRVVGITAPAVSMEERQVEAVKGAISQTAETAGSGIKEGVGTAKGVATSPSIGKEKKEGKKKKPDTPSKVGGK